MQRLPNELWQAIFAHFQCEIPDARWVMTRDRFNHEPLKTLITLSLVCRQFYSVAQGLLYRVVVSGIRDDEHARQALLARSLAHHPEVGRGIRFITIDDIEWPRDAALSSLLERRLHHLNMPQAFQRLWDKRMQTPHTSMTPRNRNNLTTFILALAPYVRLVDITYSCPSQALFWVLGGSLGKRKEIAYTDSNEFYDNAAAQTPYGKVAESYANYLPNLQELRLRGAGYNSAIEPSPPISDFRRVLLHPNLRILRTQGFHWLSFEKETRLWASFPIRIQCLDLSEAIIDAATIRHILTICKDLRSLSITLGNVDKSGFDLNWRFDLTDIGHTLRDLGQNLFEFSLHTDGFEAHRPCDGFVGSLRSLPCLRHLCITRENLVGVHGMMDTMFLSEALPTSLVTLCFYAECFLSADADYPDVFQEANDEVCGAIVDGEFPDLQAVTIFRFCPEDKLRGGEFGSGIEGWDVFETMQIEPGDDSDRLMRLNTYLTRRADFGL